MGQGISQAEFKPADFQRFQTRLGEETGRLAEWFHAGYFARASGVGGFELEGWLVDRAGRPAPLNQAFLARLADPLVVPELSVFNIELNTPPLALHGPALRRMHADLESLCQRYPRVAAELNSKAMLIGIPPTLRAQDLSLEH
ncbi:MAG TPA: glutamate--cysteine ligase, partial [Candidatus Competibacteraceae bacterium]|nr:glutamate--cysteine ligase [Candidatus Competibacteraceae bacterium]